MGETVAAGMRIGTGYDIHRLAGGVPFFLGGVAIEYPRGPVGHSDGDVLLHAIIDAVLGAAGMGDIGRHFPPDAPEWRGVASSDLLRHTGVLVRKSGFRVHNIDATVILERPRLAAAIPAICSAIAATLEMEVAAVNVKAKTNEGIGAVGRGRAVAAHAVALLEEVPRSA